MARRRRTPGHAAKPASVHLRLHVARAAPEEDEEEVAAATPQRRKGRPGCACAGIPICHCRLSLAKIALKSAARQRLLWRDTGASRKFARWRTHARTLTLPYRANLSARGWPLWRLGTHTHTHTWAQRQSASVAAERCFCSCWHCCRRPTQQFSRKSERFSNDRPRSV